MKQFYISFSEILFFTLFDEYNKFNNFEFKRALRIFRSICPIARSIANQFGCAEHATAITQGRRKVSIGALRDRDRLNFSRSSRSVDPRNASARDRVLRDRDSRKTLFTRVHKYIRARNERHREWILRGHQGMTTCSDRIIERAW